MDVKLKVIVGGSAGQEIAIPGPKFFIGRAEDCQLRPRSDLISRHHCALIIEENLVAVRDFGSKNGTHVNGERVAAERELKDGDILKVGPLEFEVSIKVSVTAKKRPKVTSVEEAATRTATTDFDLDSEVGEWLSPAERAAGNAETSIVNPRDTEEVVLGANTTVVAPGKQPGKPYLPPQAYVSPEGRPGEDAPKSGSDSTVSESGTVLAKGSAEKKSAGKLPAPPPAKDSFSAAADMLRKMRKR
jgi:pSer/pThr/pTyr-binding forkhead associated (FHA) protein